MVARQCASLPAHISSASLKRCPGPFLAHYEGLTPAIEPRRRSARLFIKKSTQGRPQWRPRAFFSVEQVEQAPGVTAARVVG
jgi:hypothetical protein